MGQNKKTQKIPEQVACYTVEKAIHTELGEGRNPAIHEVREEKLAQGIIRTILPNRNRKSLSNTESPVEPLSHKIQDT
jgi:hypothetical protein